MPNMVVALEPKLGTHIGRKSPTNIQLYNCDCQPKSMHQSSCNKKNAVAIYCKYSCDIHFFKLFEQLSIYVYLIVVLRPPFGRAFCLIE